MSGALECTGVIVSPGGAPVLRDLHLQVAAGQRAALVGPSGAGKTTLLRAVAGLARLEAGEIRLAGRSLRSVPPHRRGVAIVFQEPRLLPHLDVIDNVALPLRAAGVDRRARRQLAHERLDEVGLAGLADRRVQGLSGGEQQRVALARALCADPALLLLDEPLASLDPNRRGDLRKLLVRVQQERRLTTLVVTHDRAEAAELGQTIALMLEGRVIQHDEPRVLFERPASAAVARFFGMVNLLRGTLRGGRFEFGGSLLAAPGPDGPCTVAIRPEHVRINHAGPLRAIVVESVYAGTSVRLILRCDGQDLEAHVPVDAAVAVGERIGVALPNDHLWRIPDSAADGAGAAADQLTGSGPRVPRAARR